MIFITSTMYLPASKINRYVADTMVFKTNNPIDNLVSEIKEDIISHTYNMIIEKVFKKVANYFSFIYEGVKMLYNYKQEVDQQTVIKQLKEARDRAESNNTGIIAEIQIRRIWYSFQSIAGPLGKCTFVEGEPYIKIQFYELNDYIE